MDSVTVLHFKFSFDGILLPFFITVTRYIDYRIIHLSNFSSPSYYPFQAFINNNAWWGGRKNSQGLFEIGGETSYPRGQSLTVEMIQLGGHVVTKAVEDRLKAARNGVKFMVEKNGNWEQLCILTIKRGITMSCAVNLR